MPRALLLLLSSLTVFAQSAQRSELLASADSPHSLARYIDSHTGFDGRPLWEALSIFDAPILRCERPGVCSTELIAVPNPRQTILVIRMQNVAVDTYIRYWGDESSGWRRDGVYVAWIKYYPPRHEVTRRWNKPFLRISTQGVSGSEVGEELEDWIDLTQPGFKPVFGFAPQGHQYRLGFGIGRKLQASASTSLNNGVESIAVRINITILGDQLPLGEVAFVETYERRPGETEFTLRARSGQPRLTDQEYDDLLDFDLGPTNEQLLVHALPDLQRVARGGNVSAKAWLREMLGHCEDTAEKRTLLTLLARP